MVLITGNINNPDGSPYIGSVKFVLNDLGIEGNTLYLPTMISVVSDGTLTVDLWPNTNSLTATYYKCSLDNGSAFKISVPDVRSSYSLGEVILIDPGTLEPGIIQHLNVILDSALSGMLTRIGELEGYTGISDNRIPSTAITGEYPDMVAGEALKVNKTLTTGDGLTGGTYRGDTDVTVAVDSTVVRDTDSRLSNAREWVAPTAPSEVVSQPSNTSRYAWTPQRIWESIVSWFSNITSDDLPEGSNNLYYTDSRVTNNPVVVEHTTKLSGIEAGAQVNTVESVSGKTGDVVLVKSDVGLSNVPNIDTTDATNITSGTLSSDLLQFGQTSGLVTEGNDPRLSDAREWIAQTAPIEVVSQPTNTTRYAWTPQRIWDAILSWFSTITSDNLPEGSNNLYYTDSRVANNLAVQANTGKVSATGTVTTHSDVTSAGSGQIITISERTKLDNIEDNAQVNTVGSVAGKTGDVVLSKSDVGLSNVPNIDTTNASNISSGTLDGSRLSYGNTAGKPAQGNDPRFTDAREWTSPTVSLAEAQSGTSATRRAWTSQRVRDNVASYTQPFTQVEKSKLSGLESANYLPVDGTAVNSQLLDSLDSSQFLRSGVADNASGRIRFSGSQTGSIADHTTGENGGIELYSGIGNNAAFMAFHKPLVYGAFFGLDTDNQFKVGGWSMGNNSYKLWHEGNDGLGSGLDADLWGGWQRDTYLNQAVSTNSIPTFNGLHIYDDSNLLPSGNIRLGRYSSQYITFSGGPSGNIITSVSTTSNPKPLIININKGETYTRYVFDTNVLTIPSSLSFGPTMKQHINLYSSSYGLGVQSGTSYWRTGNNFALYKGGVHSDVALDAGSGGTRVFDYQGGPNEFNFNSYVNFNANGIKISGTSANIKFEDTDHRTFWILNSGDRFFILSDKSGDGGYEEPHPAYWEDTSQKAYFWGKEVAINNAASRFTTVDISNSSSTKLFRQFPHTDNYFYMQQRTASNLTYEANIIRFGATEVRHYVPLVNGSSRHIKDIKGSIPDGLGMVNRLNPVVYNYKGQDNTEVGLIAEEVPPESHLVYGSGADMAVDYTKLPIYMIDAIKQLTRRIEILEGNAKQ